MKILAWKRLLPQRKEKFLTKKSFFLPLLFLLSCAAGRAGVPSVETDSLTADLSGRLVATETEIDTSQTYCLNADVEALAFFQDNEYDGPVSKGYSVPGVWLRPRLTYIPYPQIKLELGLHALIYDGANKYPCYAYRDIATWKGNQYQSGSHVLPFFRAQARLGKADVVLGNLYGGSQHGLALPLYNPELNLTADPEMGAQLRLALPYYHLDTWIDWQSYIFEQDTHQEAFSVGVVQRIRFNRKPRAWEFSVPLQVVLQHRGGEQDNTYLGVQTLVNAAAGVSVQWNARRPTLTRMNIDIYGLEAWQQSGKLWPFDLGAAFFGSVSADLWDALRLKGGVFHSKDFVSLYGAPFFGSCSTKTTGGRFTRMTTGYWSVEYSKTFSRRYVFGAKAEGYVSCSGDLYLPSGVEKGGVHNAFSFGLYLKIHPRFLLKNFGRSKKK